MTQNFPSIVQFWDDAKNETPLCDVAPSSKSSFHWRCKDVAGEVHAWESSPKKGSLVCPTCNGQSRMKNRRSQGHMLHQLLAWQDQS